MSQQLIINKFQYKQVHIIGIFGIGMSALAQMLISIGVKVSGSDRDINKEENKHIFRALTHLDIKLYPQDGSFCNNIVPDVLVYSTAIEKDNKDFTSAQEIPTIHRAEMLASILKYKQGQGKTTLAVCGSCGKTTVTAWISETLYHLGNNPTMIGGGFSNLFKTDKTLGNFISGSGDCIIFEADESDKSLLKYSPDFAIITNIGTDHYPKNELKVLFKEFLKNVKQAVVVSEYVYLFLGASAFEHLSVVIFTENRDTLSGEIPISIPKWFYSDYLPNLQGISLNIHSPDLKILNLDIPAYGQHSAMNAIAVIAATVSFFQSDYKSSGIALQKFNGVYRRFTYKGINLNNSSVYDDYAHNVEKIVSCIKSAQEITENKRIFLIFQPHGFAPLKFMREKLFKELEKVLRKNDEFIFLPVFYAGGSTSFSPSSEEVYKDYSSNGLKKYAYYASRDDVLSYINKTSKNGDLIIVCGARDNSLPRFAQKFT